jgi:mannosyltransferase OCH1-like enzyme
MNIIENNQKTIPNYIFRTCESDITELPNEFHKILNETHNKNDDYIQIYFSSYERKFFVKTYYSSYYELYLSLVPGAYQADLFRLLILYSFGGLYADISVRFLRNISSFIDSTDEFISVKEISNWGIQQTFIAAYPKHPLILKMIELVTENISRRDYGTNYLDITGPYAIFRAFNQFFGFPDEQPIQGGLQVIKNYRIKFFITFLIRTILKIKISS